jgi:hypothetical protein|tara:strand:- start:783 stop:1349 length:567 start_codon:yes stop_codon:yes gene_type:complete
MANKRSKLEMPLIIGIDESNHGRDPEIFVAAITRDTREALNTHPVELDKPRDRGRKKCKVKNPTRSLGMRDYTFLSAHGDDYARISEKKFMPTIITSLLIDKIDPEQERIHILVDGHLDTHQTRYTRDLLVDHMSLERGEVHVLGGAKFDEFYPIVNLADSLAYWIFKNRSKSNPRREKHRRNILLNV